MSSSNSSPKLYHVFSHFYPATRIGGPIYCSIELIDRLSSSFSQEVLAFTSCVNRSEWLIRENFKCNITADTFFEYIRYTPFSYFKLFHFVVRASCDLSPSVIVLHGTYNIQYLFSFLLAWCLRVKCIIIPHGTLDINRRKNSRSWPVKRLSALYLKLIVGRAFIFFSNEKEIQSAAIVCSDRPRFFTLPVFVPSCDEDRWQSLLSLLISKRKFLFSDSLQNSCPNFSDLSKQISSFLVSDQFSQGGSSSSKIIISYFGRISSEKGLHRILPDLARLYKAGLISPFVIFGDGSDPVYVGQIRSICSSLDFPLYITGFLQRSLALKILHYFSPVLVFPSLSDNFNLCLHEALAIGLKVFASDRINSIESLNAFSTLNILPYNSFGSSLAAFIASGDCAATCSSNDKFKSNLQSLNLDLLAKYSSAFNSVLISGSQ